VILQGFVERKTGIFWGISKKLKRDFMASRCYKSLFDAKIKNYQIIATLSS